MLSLRATGEGHISSITFRTGVVHPDGQIEVFAPAGFLAEPRQIPNPHYEKALFLRKLGEMGMAGEFSRQLMDTLGDSFSLEDLRAALSAEKGRHTGGMTQADVHESRDVDAGAFQLRSSVPD